MSLREIRKFFDFLSNAEIKDTEIQKILFFEISAKFKQITPLSCASLAESFARLKILDAESTQLFCMGYENSARQLLSEGDEDPGNFLPQTFRFFFVLKKVQKYRPPLSTVMLAVEIVRKFLPNFQRELSPDLGMFLRSLYVLGFKNEAVQLYREIQDLEISLVESERLNQIFNST